MCEYIYSCYVCVCVHERERREKETETEAGRALRLVLKAFLDLTHPPPCSLSQAIPELTDMVTLASQLALDPRCPLSIF